MSYRSYVCLAFAPLVALACTVEVHGEALVSKGSAAKSDREAVRLQSYAKPNGTNFFALSLKPTAEHIASMDVAKSGHDVIVLFDTSASQIGVYREKALKTLDLLLTKFSSDDRLHLMAVDLEANPMTDSFVSSTSEEMKAGVAKLHRRTPLGSTDMTAVFEAVLKTFETNGDNTQSRTVIYIGDGIGSANLAASKSFRTVLDSLVANHISVTSLAIGPRHDALLLAALANRTGGMLAVDGSKFSASDAAEYLADKSRGTVIWTESTEWPESLNVYPSKIQPLRTDRHTVVVGTGKVDAQSCVKFSGNLDGQSIELSWALHSSEPNRDNAFIIGLVEAAQDDNGSSLATLGTAGLDVARRVNFGNTHFLVETAKRAISLGNLKSARPLINQLRHIDPRHPQLEVLEGSLNKLNSNKKRPAGVLKLGQRQPKRSKNVFRMVRYQAPGNRNADNGNAFIDEVEQERRAYEAKIQKEIEVDLNAARALMATSPGQAVIDLKLRLTYLERSPELSSEVLAQLRSKIQGAIKQAQHREYTNSEAEAIRLRAEAARRERERIAAALQADQERVRQLMGQFETLMDEGRHDQALHAMAEQLGNDVERLMPETVASTSAIHSSRMTGFYRQSRALRDAHQRGMNDMLLQVDISGTPFSDDPPITYPDAEVWEELTNRRTAYSSVDLQQRGGTEEKIFKALQENASFELIQTPLEEITQIIEENHGIQVELDLRALNDVGIDPQVPITKSLSGISLRSALRLILSEFELTYVVDNEVLMITTTDKAGGHLTTKVYPVADLVLPIQEIGFTGGFGALGGFGNNSQGTAGGGLNAGGAFGGGGQGGAGF